MSSEFIYKKKIGQILIENDFITEEQLSDSLKIQIETSDLIGEILIQKGYLTEEQLAQGLAIQFDSEYYSPDRVKLEEAVLARVPENLIKMYYFIPLDIDAGRIMILIFDPTNVTMLDALQTVLGIKVEFAVASKEKITQVINDYYFAEEKEKTLDDVNMDEMLSDAGLDMKVETIGEDDAKDPDLLKAADQKPIIALVNKIILDAIKKKASDIHLEVHEKKVVIRYRMDGDLYDQPAINKKAASAIVSRIKIISNLNIAEKRIPQDGAFSLKIGKSKIDFRVSVLPCIWGENVVIRILSKDSVSLDLETLGFTDFQLKIFKKNIQKPFGLILNSGPTGSGKTTTLYAALSRINTRDVKIITVEDPVEYQLEGIHQTQVFINKNEPDRSLTFASGLRSILRQDPDVVMIGEIRDETTAEIAVNAALTGHLVFSTVHANNSIDVINRMKTLGVDKYLLCSAFVMVIAQRLVKQLCTECKEEYDPSEEEFEAMGKKKSDYPNQKFFRPVGCDKCNGTGYKGRRAVYEILDLTPAIKELIVTEKTPFDIQKKAVEQGTDLLVDAGMIKAIGGSTSLEEVKSLAADF
ncbi:MAG: Flp pilus assembly complex ATPase component TadA [Candidatus Muirbacterium halophilum]|nr:Flp pilus assembly complex ATPase component TadA [Candidatus Muirbacterium halophilum]